MYSPGRHVGESGNGDSRAGIIELVLVGHCYAWHARVLLKGGSGTTSSIMGKLFYFILFFKKGVIRMTLS